MRIITKIDYKNGHVIKGRRYEGFKKVGPFNDIVSQYYHDGACEFIFYDCVAALFGRPKLHRDLALACSNIFVPVTVGGGIRTYDQAANFFQSGADRVAVNSKLFDDDYLIERIADSYGSQSIVAMLEVKKIGTKWLLFTELGREPIGLSLAEGFEICLKRGVGEICLNAIDFDGLLTGFPTELCALIPPKFPVPIILSGGFGGANQMQELCDSGYEWLSGFALAAAFHQNRIRLADVKSLIKPEFSNNDL